MSTLAEHVAVLIARRAVIQPGENVFFLWDDRQFKTDALLLCTTHLDELARLTSEAQTQTKVEARAVLTDAQIRKGWEATFSTNNPFCPCDLKSFTKAVNWAQRAIEAAGGTGT